MANGLVWLTGFTLVYSMGNALAHSDILTAAFCGSGLMVCAIVYKW